MDTSLIKSLPFLEISSLNINYGINENYYNITNFKIMFQTI